MCTVTYVKQGDSICLTSNRDENRQRKAALSPSWQTVKGKRLLFPQDPQAGGSWFVVTGDGDAAVLLNGALQKHEPRYPYRKSRGMLLVEMMSKARPVFFFRKAKLDGIEPFTIVYAKEAWLWVLQWDGQNRHFSMPDPAVPHIWSSVTLYTPEVIKWRENLFEQFLFQHPGPLPDDLLQFHQTQNDDAHNGFVMSRPSGVFTHSVTQAVIHPGGCTLSYTDLITNKNTRVCTQPGYEQE